MQQPFAAEAATQPQRTGPTAPVRPNLLCSHRGKREEAGLRQVPLLTRRLQALPRSGLPPARRSCRPCPAGGGAARRPAQGSAGGEGQATAQGDSWPVRQRHRQRAAAARAAPPAAGLAHAGQRCGRCRYASRHARRCSCSSTPGGRGRGAGSAGACSRGSRGSRWPFWRTSAAGGAAAEAGGGRRQRGGRPAPGQVLQSRPAAGQQPAAAAATAGAGSGTCGRPGGSSRASWQEGGFIRTLTIGPPPRQAPASSTPAAVAAARPHPCRPCSRGS